MDILVASPNSASTPFTPNWNSTMKARIGFLDELTISFESTPRRRNIINIYQHAEGNDHSGVVSQYIAKSSGKSPLKCRLEHGRWF
jgi:hypothetical protein